MNTTTDSEGKSSLPVKAPDATNTSFVVSAFSLDQLHGMGISEVMANLEIFQPFYVKVQLPYSVKKGETLAVQMVSYGTAGIGRLAHKSARLVHPFLCSIYGARSDHQKICLDFGAT